MRGAECNGIGEIGAHAHRQQLQAVALRDFRRQRKVRARRFIGRRNTHQPRDRQSVSRGASLDESIRVLRQHTGLLRFGAGIDLHEQSRCLAGFLNFLGQRFAQAVPIDRMNGVEQRDLVAADRSLVPAMVAEMIRFQTPVIHMRRTALEDAELGGRTIRKGDKVVLWYVSGNRDESVFADPERFLVSRPNARRHLAFGAGIHRCVGDGLAELQLRVLWEEVLERDLRIAVAGEPERVYSNFIRGFNALPVRIEA